MSMQLSAVQLATATANDPQFRLPERPCLVEGLVLAWTATGLLVEGTGTRRALSGKSAQHILPGLLPLLDGTRALPELAELTQLDEARIHAVLLLLYSCGMLQEGPHPEPARRDAAYALLSRLLDTTRVNASVAEAQTRLETTTAIVVAPEPFAGTLTDEPATGLAVVWIDRDCEAAATAACVAHYRAGIPVLLVGFDVAGFSLGPYLSLIHI